LFFNYLHKNKQIFDYIFVIKNSIRLKVFSAVLEIRYFYNVL